MKSCPGVEHPQDWKIGVADLSDGKARKRLAAYQNAVGPVHEEKFTRVFVGDSLQIKHAEKQFKRIFKSKIGSAEAGFSEWISGVSLEELVQFVDELRNDYFVKIHNVPAEFEPLTMPMCEELEQWFNRKWKSNDLQIL
jgi:hypothetical protein